MITHLVGDSSGRTRHRFTGTRDTLSTKAGMMCAALLLAVLFAFVPNAYSQTDQTIHGTVTDATSKEKMPGVAVSIPALHIGAITKSNGEYTIRNVPVGTHKVEAKILGYKTQSKSVSVAEGQNPTADFSLELRPLEPNEIVVTGLSGEVDRRTLGNSIGRVQGAELRATTTPAAIDALEGRVPGVLVQKNSGAVGSGSYITIRGRHSVSGGSEPLYVVDGTIIDNSQVFDEHGQNGSVQLSNRAVDINAQDIENVEVLKGASASAMYGSLAANGVILITTKRGNVLGNTDKTAGIQYTSSFQSDTRLGTYSLQNKFAQGSSPTNAKSNLSYGKALPTDTLTYNHADEPFRTAGSYIQNLTISGGTPALTYLLSGSLENLQGIVIGSALDNRTLRLNLGTTILPKVDVQTNFNFISTNNNLPQEGSNTSGILLGALRTPAAFNNTMQTFPDGTQHQFWPTYDNPLWTQTANTFDSKVSRFIQSTNAKWSAMDWLTIDGRIGYDHYSYQNIERLDPQSSTTGKTGRISHTINELTNVNTDLTATGVWKASDDLSLTLVAGGQTIWTTSSSDRTQADNITPFFDQMASGATKTSTSSRSETKLIGLFAQATADLWNRLDLTASVRRDGSSTFGTSDKYHYYPKFGLNYDIGKESFMEGTRSTISSVKIRAAYGQAGSPYLPGAYSSNIVYSAFGNNDGWGRRTSAGRGGFIGIRQAGGDDNSLFVAANQDIRPEISTEREYGLDLGFWEERVKIEGTFYHTNVNDMILNVPTAGSTGFDITQKNAGSMWNEGFEYGVNVNPIRTEDFTWNTHFNYARNYNLVTSLNVHAGDNSNSFVSIYGFTGTENVAQVGHPLGVMQGLGYVHNADGTIKTSTGKADDYFGKDYSNAPIIDPNPKIVGDPNAHYTFSWQNDFAVMKDLKFSFMVDAVQGGQIWNGTKGALYRFGTAGETADRNDPWFFQGKPVIDNATGKQLTRETYYRFYANSFQYGIEEPMMEDGSFVKLREMSISYDWHGLRDWKIENVNFTLTGRNLITWTKYTGFDPEINTFSNSEARGFDYFTIPGVRSYRFSVSLTY